MKKNKIIRLWDILLSLTGIVGLFPILLIIFALNSLGKGSSLFKQKRLGMDLKKFTLYKFRTMTESTIDLPTHLVDPMRITKFGSFLRNTKIDELPQLWNVLIGDMSMVGPRPCLPQQYELISERIKRDIFSHRPGITGLAQINSIDMSDPKKLAEIDSQMLNKFSTRAYFIFILKTLFGKGYGDKVRKTKI